MIVDFYCPKELLVIELDGDGHDTASGQQRDGDRDRKLQQLGFTVLRYENEEVFNHPESVLNDIMLHFTTID